MTILLDTHVLLWLGENDDSLGKQAIEIIRASNHDLWASAMSFWEVSMLVDKQRIILPMALDDWRQRTVARGGLRIAAITPEIATDAGALPGSIHGDPADRLIIASARALGRPVLTADRKILAYADEGHVNVIDARR